MWDHNACALRRAVSWATKGAEGYILCEANEVLMVGVNVGQLNVNQQQNLNQGQKIMIRMEGPLIKHHLPKAQCRSVKCVTCELHKTTTTEITSEAKSTQSQTNVACQTDGV